MSDHVVQPTPSADPTPEVAADPGMAVKMAPPSLPDLDRAIADASLDPAAVRALLEFIDARLDCADFRLVTVLKLLYAAPDAADPELAAEMKRTVLGFKYWMDEPGEDGMCQWSENHQALFGVCELLAGQLYPDERFTNNGLTGHERYIRGHDRIRRWLEHRFRFGFAEWCSPTYYEEDVAALALLIDHVQDEDLVTRARMILDLALLDMALHRYNGRFVGTSGRCYEAQKKDPAQADVNDVLAHAFGASPEPPKLDRLSSVFILARRYATPAALRAIADSTDTAVVRESTGLELPEVAPLFPDDPTDPDTAGAFYWLMEAFTNPESVRATMRAFRAWHLERNRFLAPLAPFAKIADVPGVGPRALPGLVRALNPATQGVAIQRANIYAYRTPHFHLSSAQSHHAGEFGDQQHLWQATLPRDITMFATHPGAPMFDSAARNFSPSYWVGNGINPEIGQYRGQLVALYDTRGRRGYLEKKRQRFTHLWLPTARLDRLEVGPDWLAGQVGDTFVGVRTLRPFELVSPDELVQRGTITGYGVTLASTREYSSLGDFAAQVRRSELVLRPHRLAFYTAQACLEVRRRQGLWVDGVAQPHDFPRYDSPWVQAPRDPDRFDIRCGGHRLLLDWAAGIREESSC